MSSESIDAAFSSFVDDMFDILEQENFSKVKRKPLENLNVAGGIPFTDLEDIEDKIDESQNLSNLFDVLSRRCRPYWNWMNIRMLEKMAGNSSAAKQSIKNYKDNIYSRKVKDVMLEISNLEIPKNGYTEIKDKWNKDFDDLIIKDVVKRWNELENKFNVDETMLLKNITKGCVEICWLLPNHLVDHAVCSATKNQQGKHHDDDDDDDQSGAQDLFPEVLYLKIGDLVIKGDKASKLFNVSNFNQIAKLKPLNVKNNSAGWAIYNLEQFINIYFVKAFRVWILQIYSHHKVVCTL